tara:strand:- start:164 stop:895 length:732 start_codon:yes stop_codon:yes gene_type:complete
MKICVLLTQYKRNHLEEQLIHIKNQTKKPDFLVVFQNENHINIENLKKKYDFIHVKSDFNTKFFGRFSYCFNIPADIFLIFDDDIIPGNKCIENYVNQCLKLNSIIGGNGRYGYLNKNNHYKFKIQGKNPLSNLKDIGIRKLTLVDFVGHLWCFKKEWLYYMFAIKPFTYDTSEDMHFCFSSKLLGNINSYYGEQLSINSCCDISMNKYADDKFSSYKTTNSKLREGVEKYFLSKGLKLIEKN